MAITFEEVTQTVINLLRENETLKQRILDLERQLKTNVREPDEIGRK